MEQITAEQAQEQLKMQREQMTLKMAESMTTDNLLDDGDTSNIPPLQTNPTMTGDSYVSNFLTQDEFYQGFKQVFAFGGELINSEAMPIKEHEELGARKTSDKLFDMANRYSFMQFLIDKRANWFSDAILISIFAYGKTTAVVEEKFDFTFLGFLKGKYPWIPLKTATPQKQKQKGWGFLGRRGVEKQPTQEDLLKESTDS